MERQFNAEIESLKLGAGATFHGEGILAVTKALLQSIPRLGVKKNRDYRLASIHGSVPDPYNLPAGCSFHPRCAQHISGTCEKEVPRVVEVESGHKVRCVLYYEH